eukprot:9483531-Pyramimonas_sp.AAC.1
MPDLRTLPTPPCQPCPMTPNLRGGHIGPHPFFCLEPCGLQTCRREPPVHSQPQRALGPGRAMARSGSVLRRRCARR